MSQADLLKRVTGALDGAAIPYMLTGSLASSLQGAPRATHDIDLVVAVETDDVGRLLAALQSPNLYLDEASAADAVRSRSMFNLVDPLTGDKVDFWLLTRDDFDQARFARRITVEALGTGLVVSAPEDTILMKLHWSRQAGGSQKQVADAVAVYELQGGTLDQAYLDEWAYRLGVTDLLGDVRKRAEPLVE